MAERKQERPKDCLFFEKEISVHEFCDKLKIGPTTLIRLSRDGLVEVNVNRNGKIPADEANSLIGAIDEMKKEGIWPGVKQN